MSYLGSWKIDDLLTFVAVTTRVDTGAATDADSAPSYRVYEDETSTPILTGSMALLDSANTAGFYSEQITLSAANGFEKGKSYSVYIQATVNSVIGATCRNFQIQAEAAITAGQLFVKKNTALANFPFKLVSSTDHVTPATGKTPTVQRSIDGAAFGNAANTPATEISAGWYKISLDAADLNGTTIAIKVTATGCDQRDFTIVTQA